MILLVVVVPTYNEAKNITKLIESIFKNISSSDKIIIVDDNSPDGTGKIADKIVQKKKNLIVIHRKRKEGRGSAVWAGFRLAKKFNPTFYIEMDADFSHKPRDIPRLLSAIKQGSDVVVGSRYLGKSKIYNWSISRRVFSKFANFYANLILDVGISDYTNGFRIYTKEAVNFLLSQKLISPGYILLSETAFKLKKAGFKLSEIPIIFVNRKRGVSNLNFNEIKNAFLKTLKIRFLHS